MAPRRRWGGGKMTRRLQPAGVTPAPRHPGSRPPSASLPPALPQKPGAWTVAECRVPPTSHEMAVILTWQVIFSGSLALNLAPSPASAFKRLLSTREKECESSPGRPPRQPAAPPPTWEQRGLRGSRPPEGRE